MKVLIVEDDQTLKLILNYHFKLYDFEVNNASNGKEGLISVINDPPDLIITDIMMPKMNGIDFIKNMSSLDLIKIPIIIITAGNYSFDESNPLKDIPILRKPLNIENLLKLSLQLCLKDNYKNDMSYKVN